MFKLNMKENFDEALLFGSSTTVEEIMANNIVITPNENYPLFEIFKEKYGWLSDRRMPKVYPIIDSQGKIIESLQIQQSGGFYGIPVITIQYTNDVFIPKVITLVSLTQSDILSEAIDALIEKYEDKEAFIFIRTNSNSGRVIYKGNNPLTENLERDDLEVIDLTNKLSIIKTRNLTIYVE